MSECLTCPICGNLICGYSDSEIRCAYCMYILRGVGAVREHQRISEATELRELVEWVTHVEQLRVLFGDVFIVKSKETGAKIEASSLLEVLREAKKVLTNPTKETLEEWF